ncbi:SLIP-like protein, partial [Mya arenaria]
PEAFRRQVEKYIETQDPVAEGQYWPIVKHVRLRIPKCDVFSSGTALVDLPGVRDSNAARDKIAKDYLKNCTAVLVVSSINRAVYDKVAKDLLGEKFRRQLLMDGQYGNIAFICTKTDVLMPSEIIRSLNLEEKTKEYEVKVKNMENEKAALDIEITNVNKLLPGLRKSIEKQKNEARPIRDTLAKIDSLLEPAEGKQ